MQNFWKITTTLALLLFIFSGDLFANTEGPSLEETQQAAQFIVTHCGTMNGAANSLDKKDLNKSDLAEIDGMLIEMRSAGDFVVAGCHASNSLTLREAAKELDMKVHDLTASIEGLRELAQGPATNVILVKKQVNVINKDLRNIREIATCIRIEIQTIRTK